MRKGPIHAALLLLAGCAGSPEARYFTLSAVAPAQPPAAARPLYHLAMVKLPELYDRPQMVIRTGPNSVEISEYDRWAEPLERMTARILAQDVAQRRPQGAGPLVATADQPRLQVAIDEFAVDRAAGQARLSGTWKVTAADGAPHGAPFSFSRPASASPEAAAEAMSALLGRLADEIDRD